jgi:hypothetical protein
VPGERVPAISGKTVTYRDGAAVFSGQPSEPTPELSSEQAVAGKMAG